MIAMLRAEWSKSLSVPEFIALSQRLDDELRRIRSERGIDPPMIWCPRCQKRVRSAPPRVSVRAAILALERFAITEPEIVITLKREWRRYQAKEGLDIYGQESIDRETSANGSPASECLMACWTAACSYH